MCAHYRRLKTNRPVPPVTKHEEKKDAGPAMQEVEDNDLVVDATKHEENNKAAPATQKVQDIDVVVGADSGNTKIITMAVPMHAEDGTEGNFRQKDMRVLRFWRTRHYLESGIMNARKKIETWNAAAKDHLEAMNGVTSRGADFEAFRESMEGPCCSLAYAVGRVHQAPVGSSA